MVALDFSQKLDLGYQSNIIEKFAEERKSDKIDIDKKTSGGDNKEIYKNSAFSINFNLNNDNNSVTNTLYSIEKVNQQAEKISLEYNDKKTSIKDDYEKDKTTKKHETQINAETEKKINSFRSNDLIPDENTKIIDNEKMLNTEKYLYNTEQTNKEFTKKTEEYLSKINEYNLEKEFNITKKTPEESLEEFHEKAKENDSKEISNSLNGGNKSSLSDFLEKVNEKTKEMASLLNNNGLSLLGQTDNYLKQLSSLK
jgi:hypothetical protein